MCVLNNNGFLKIFIGYIRGISGTHPPLSYQQMLGFYPSLSSGVAGCAPAAAADAGTCRFCLPSMAKDERAEDHFCGGVLEHMHMHHHPSPMGGDPIASDILYQ